ncbi:hypothetical protein JL09_g6895 [Pichia kudriavzevii]|uniref:Uncharacterized protein n=1 Tax=Pichia kudriavzevii TaxID=4909 RepID=A0A099NIH5_PICKU|nr:hypothetical protein JL09_g6895 [Pichia kudriavzevii]
MSPTNENSPVNLNIFIHMEMYNHFS